MYVAGNYRESVTRYTHKNCDRWMRPARPVHSINWADVQNCIIITLSVSILIALGVVILQTM